jgi:putative nucleotidyltransferase with HDIG domain
VREGLEGAVQQEQTSIAKASAQAVERNRRVLGVVSQNPALKAVVQQMLSDRKDAQARRTVEDHLQEIGTELGFDFLMVSDADGAPLAAVIEQGGRFVASTERPPREGFFSSRAHTYRVTSVPIDTEVENLGTLSVGELFQLTTVPGAALLLHNGHVVETNIAGLPEEAIESGLRHCGQNGVCEIRAGGQTYVSLPLETESSNGYQVRSFTSVDAAARPIQVLVRRVFEFTAVAALLAAVLMSGLSSRSIVRPISGLIARLQESARTGELPEFDSRVESIQEIRELTQSFNRAAAAVRDGRDRLQRANVEFIEALASALDARDPYTAGHSRRVSQLASVTAQALGLPPEEVHRIRIGALLHDVGKIGVSDSILSKPGRLTPEEDAKIRQHPRIGRRILEGVNGFQPYLDVVELHHENWDGTGYPKGLEAEQTPLAARIVKIADAWDAMTSDRVYRKGMSQSQALALLRRVAGTQTDPVVTELFCNLWAVESGSLSKSLEGLKEALQNEALQNEAASDAPSDVSLPAERKEL